MKDLLTPILMSTIAGLSTGLGGLFGIFKKLSMRQFDTLIGFSAGVMFAVATFGLIDEGMILIETYNLFQVVVVIIGGVIVGILFLLTLDYVLPHLHSMGDKQNSKKKFKEEFCERECMCPFDEKEKWFKCPYLKEGKCTLQGNCFCPKKIEFQRKMRYSGILLAIGLTLHNAPEGIAVGVGFLATPLLGFAMTFAIALHNIPEGIAVSLPLLQGNYTKKKALLISFLSGLAEPISCIISLLFLQWVSDLFLAFFLTFAGGAMIYITSDELIPESHSHGYEHEASIGIMLGFILMLVLMIGFGI
ncbi:MAG: ZIP family metal transporter [Candidatus Helarchaeota archaeon]